MSDLRPIWTPQDYADTLRDAGRHRAEPAELDDDEDQDHGVADEPADLAKRYGFTSPTSHRAATVAGMRPSRALYLTRVALGVATVVLVMAIGALWASAHAKADRIERTDDGNVCLTQFWLVPFQTNTRTICDAPIREDGSWARGRVFWSPAYTSNAYSSCYRYGCTFYPAVFHPEHHNEVETYIVRPENVLADEPGHLA